MDRRHRTLSPQTRLAIAVGLGGVIALAAQIGGMLIYGHPVP